MRSKFFLTLMFSFLIVSRASAVDLSITDSCFLQADVQTQTCSVAGSNLVVGLAGSSNYHSILKFHTPTSTDVIATTTLHLKETFGYGANRTIYVHELTSPWNYTYTTYLNRDNGVTWTSPNGDFNPTPITSFYVDYTYRGWYDVVLPNVTDNDTEYNFLLESNTGNSYVSFNGDTNSADVLYVTFEYASSTPVSTSTTTSTTTTSTAYNALTFISTETCTSVSSSTCTAWLKSGYWLLNPLDVLALLAVFLIPWVLIRLFRK